MFLVPTRIDPRHRQQLLRWSREASRLRQEIAKPDKTQVFWGLRIESLETSQPRRDRRSHLPNFWSCRPSRHWELPVAGSHWPSGTTDLGGQLTENSEEPEFSPIAPIPPFAPRRRTLAHHLSACSTHLRVTGSSGARRRVAEQVPETRFSLDAIFTPVARPSPQRSLADAAHRLKSTKPNCAPRQHQ